MEKIEVSELEQPHRPLLSSGSTSTSNASTSNASTSTPTSSKKNLKCVFSLILLFVSAVIVVGTLGGLGYFHLNKNESAASSLMWGNWANGITNQRWASTETRLSSGNIGNLAVKWTFKTPVNIQVTPLVVNERVYFNDLNGTFYCLNRFTGDLLWSVDFSAVFNQTIALSKGSAALYNKWILVGLRWRAIVVLLDQITGDIVWNVSVDSHPLAVISASFTVVNDDAYIGISSNEEAMSNTLGYICCTFRGSFLKFNIPTRSIVWKFYTVPDNFGNSSLYAGNAVWGSAPSVDLLRNQVYFATGNTYRAPEPINQCQIAQNAKPVPDDPNPCIEADNYMNSVLAMSLDQGEVNWVRKVSAWDVYVSSCIRPPPINASCPGVFGPDFDFPQQPMLILNSEQDIVIAGQKTGILWGFHPATGETLWSTSIGPGGRTGGLMWGSAASQDVIYAASSNSFYLNHTLLNGEVITYGSWCAVNRSNGVILWQTAAPLGGKAAGPVTLANDIVLGSTVNDTDGMGHFYGLHRDTGSILFQSPFTWKSPYSYSGAAVVDGMIYWGADQFYAFGLN